MIPEYLAFIFFQANIVRYNEETLMKMHQSSTHAYPEPEPEPQSSKETFSSKMQESGGPFSLLSSKDLEMPMPPVALAPIQQQDIRYVFLGINSLCWYVIMIFVLNWFLIIGFICASPIPALYVSQKHLLTYRGLYVILYASVTPLPTSHLPFSLYF